MILLDIKMNNIYAFKDFHANFSYSKKIVNSNIEGEYLSNYPNFRYKKVNILMGTNASGKTTFGKAIIALFNFINRDNPTLLKDAAKLNDGDGQINIDFVAEDNDKKAWMYRIQTKITKEDGEEPVIESALNRIALGANDRYETCAAELDKMNVEYTRNTSVLFDDLPPFGWYFSDVETKALVAENKKVGNGFIKVLNSVMKSFDTFITEVTPIEENDFTSFLIKFGTGESVIYHEGEPVSFKDLLSNGTRSAFTIAEIIYRVMYRLNGFYYCDEKFCFVQSDLEKAVLSVLIELLGNDQQLFFTTHNTDILDLDLPKHTYSFFRKNALNDQMPIELICASEYIKKQDTSLRNAVENDLFSTAPDDSEIYRILDMKLMR